MSVLLISPQPNLDILGLKGLHLLLLDRGYDSTLLYLPRLMEEDDWQARLAGFVKERDPRFIGISLMAYDFDAARAITDAIKKSHPAMPIVWGGIHPTTSPEACVEYADYACVGEAEQTMLDMAQAAREGRSFDDINNLCFKRGGVFNRNPLYPLVEDLDTLPIGRQIPQNAYVLARGRIAPLDKDHLRRYRRYRGALYKLLTSRGCPHNCTYCCNHFLRQLYGRWPVRYRSVEHVMAELEAAVVEGPPVEYIDISDDCFLANDADRLALFCEQYKKRIGKPFIVKGTARYFTREKMDLLADAGLGWVNMGLQSGSQRICHEIYDHRITSEEFLEAARLIGRYPVAAYYDLLVDNPYETLDDYLQTTDVLTRIPKPYFTPIFSLILFEGTNLRERALREIPDQVEDPRGRDYLVRTRNPALALLEMASLLPGGMMRRMARAYGANPASRRIRIMMMAASVVCRIVLAPIANLRVIHRSQHGSVWGTLRVLPIFFDHAIWHYLYYFSPFKRRTRLDVQGMRSERGAAKRTG
ncbi:MAG TPA: cobalamin-dependent protein [Candidatus Hydrogenedentes bacterium]|nr:cobalamin-dependent protein [Candidatus Hydrogenedentota bacterium]